MATWSNEDRPPNLPLQGSDEERMVRAWTDERLAWSLDHLAERGAHTKAQREAIVAEAARRLRWGRAAEREQEPTT